MMICCDNVQSNVSNTMHQYDVSSMISALDPTPVTLLLEGSNVGRGDSWYVFTVQFYLYASTGLSHHAFRTFYRLKGSYRHI